MFNINNYIASYGTNDNFLWIYQNTIVNKPQKIDIPFKITKSLFNIKSNEVYLLLVNESGSIRLSAFELAFRCSSITNAINYTS